LLNEEIYQNGVFISDVDECSLSEKACRRKNENCYNTPGSFVCVCPDGFEETEDACVPAAESGEWCGTTWQYLPSTAVWLGNHHVRN
jgi:hypothetical protein